jgi:hypothetical protein
MVPLPYLLVYPFDYHHGENFGTAPSIHTQESISVCRSACFINSSDVTAAGLGHLLTTAPQTTFERHSFAFKLALHHLLVFYRLICGDMAIPHLLSGRKIAPHTL